MQYSYEFKAKTVEKVLTREPDVSFNSVAQSFGIDHSTLRRWVAKSQNHLLAQETMTREKTPQQWTPEQKLQAVIECESMDTEQLSAWCRERGIFPHHVKQWKKEFAQGASKSSSSDKARIKRLTGELKSVEKELRRKEKALAEAAALLVLKKSRPDMGNRRGRLTLSEHRGEIIAAVDEAVKCGARRSEACQVAGISIRTLQRWREPDNVHDGRTDARHEPANKLGEEERKEIVEVANSPGYSDCPRAG